MNKLIPINTEAETMTVNGRDLHAFLEVSTRYNDWFPRMCEYGFTEGVDFYSFLSKTSEGGRPSTDHLLTIDMAKEIAMLQRNEKGKQARQYFLEIEKEWNSPEKVMARALVMANKKISMLEISNKEQGEQIAKMKPKELFADAVSASETSILVGELAKLIAQNGVDIGQNRLFKWLRENGYLFKDKNEPTQKAMDMKLFEVKERTINNPDGSVRITRTTKVTGKGQVYFVNKFLEVA